jgi:lambda repressor-like predicted transcriptional regulator
MTILRSNSTRYSKFKLRLSLLSQIEQDEQVKLFFASLAEFSSDVPLKLIVEEAFRQRPRLTEEHLAYLLFASFQYVSNFRYDTLGRSGFDTVVWEDLRQHNEAILQLCLHNNLSTQCIDRYAALQIILSILKKPGISVIDLGCAAGMGLMSLNTRLVRRVKTVDTTIAFHLNQDVKIGNAVGVDMANQFLTDFRWIKACIFPEIKHRRESLEVEYNWLKQHGTKVHLIQTNFLDIPDTGIMPPNSTDVIWTSNTLYQISDTLNASLSLIRPVIGYLLAPYGLWIDAYYESWDSQFGSDENRYQICVRSRHDFDNTLVVLTAPNDNVPVIGQGEDFHAFIKRYGTR